MLTTTGALSIQLGFGDGTFAAPQDYEVTFGQLHPYALVTADFDGDGHPDFAVSDGNMTISLFAGSGTGALTAKGTLHVTGQGLVVGDLNGDGKPDLAAFGNGESSVTLLTNQGGFSFATSQVGLPSGFSPNVLAAIDINGDGRVDLVGLYGSTVGVSLNTSVGLATFTTVASGCSVGLAAPPFTVRDFNGDGKLDLLIGSENTCVAFGDGKGGFTSEVTLELGPSGKFVIQLAVGDLNGDGLPDILCNTGSEIVAYPSTHLGAWGAPISLLPASEFGTLAIADLFGTGKPEVLVTEDEAWITLLHPAPTTFLATPAILPSPSPTSQTFVHPLLVDVNGDGRPDAIEVSSATGEIGVFLSQGDGTFGAVTVYPVGTGTTPASIAAADFNGDGRLDLAVSTPGTKSVSVLLGTSKGFGPAKAYPTTYFGSGIITGDFNNDGIPDVISYGSSGSTNSGTSFLAGMTGGALAAEKANLPFGANVTITQLFGAKVNNDANLDVICVGTTNGSGYLNAGLGAGDGTFVYGTRYLTSAASTGVTKALLGDFNNDGVADVMYDGGEVEFCPGNGTSNITCQSTGVSTANTQSVVSADFDGDDNLDLLAFSASVAYPGISTVTVWRGDGKGGLSSAISRTVSASSVTISDTAAGDLTGDGRPSIFFAAEPGYYGVMLNLCQ